MSEKHEAAMQEIMDNLKNIPPPEQPSEKLVQAEILASAFMCAVSIVKENLDRSRKIAEESGAEMTGDRKKKTDCATFHVVLMAAAIASVYLPHDPSRKRVSFEDFVGCADKAWRAMNECWRVVESEGIDALGDDATTEKIAAGLLKARGE